MFQFHPILIRCLLHVTDFVSVSLLQGTNTNSFTPHSIAVHSLCLTVSVASVLQWLCVSFLNACVDPNILLPSSEIVRAGGGFDIGQSWAILLPNQICWEKKVGDIRTHVAPQLGYKFIRELILVGTKANEGTLTPALRCTEAHEGNPDPTVKYDINGCLFL